jgi:signal transduction histidine kinase
VKKLDHSIQILIQDNGKGFDMETVTFGNGLYNMEKRISDIGGTCNIHSILGKGTDINILLKIDSKTTEAV